jgi:adenine-specific DNA-methyltransferase
VRTLSPSAGQPAGTRASKRAPKTSDCFIHKDLAGFLTSELDTYVKNEVIVLTDSRSDTAPLQPCDSTVRAIRGIGGEIISFLAKSEEIHKKLLLKTKLVLETEYCLTLDRIPHDLYPEVASNSQQREEWVRLFSIDGFQNYTVPLTPDFLQAHPFLTVDTKFFPEGFKWRLESEAKDLSDSCDGLIICGEAFQALRLLRRTYEKGIDCIIIDPPYNTGSNGFAYRDKFRRSSWLTMMENCLSECIGLLKGDGIFSATIDDNELHHLGLLLNMVFGENNRAACAPWLSEPSGGKEKTGLRTGHEYVLIYHNGDHSAISQDRRTTGRLNLQDKHGPYRKGRELRKWGGISSRSDRPNQWYPLRAPDGNEVYPIKNDGSEGHWRWGKNNEFVQAALKDPDLFHWEKCPFDKGVTHRGESERWVPFEKARTTQKSVGWSTWLDTCGSNADGTRTLKDLFGKKVFHTPKPTQLYRWILSLHTNHEARVLDFFAGSGTTAQAVIDLNREDKGKRKYVLVETEDHFERALKPRIQKVIYSTNWKNGRPGSHADGVSHMFKYIRIESYDDSLGNLELGPNHVKDERLASDGRKPQRGLRYTLHGRECDAGSLVNPRVFHDATGYTLRIRNPGVHESRETAVDLPETFDHLIGLHVQAVTGPQSFSADFERDAKGVLRIRGELREDVNGPWRFRGISGATGDGQRTLVIWRSLTGRKAQDSLVLDAWLGMQGYCAREPGSLHVFVNGAVPLINLKNVVASWNMNMLEEEFFRLLWETER